jgi:predicted  nucleic acid-binding Zn-ribbon protein
MIKVIEQLYALQQVEMGPKGQSPESEPEIKKLRQLIPLPILGHYDRLRVRGKSGVALVRSGVCSGCHMKLAVGVNADLLRGDDIRLCDSCGRYLMVSPDDRQAAEAAAVAMALPVAPVVKAPAKRKSRKSSPPLETAD